MPTIEILFEELMYAMVLVWVLRIGMKTALDANGRGSRHERRTIFPTDLHH